MKPLERHQNIRDTLFGDIPLDFIVIPEEAFAVEPWASFARAKLLTESHDTRNAATTLQGVLHMPGLESRHYLQAYQCLRELGVKVPPEKAKGVLGVVVEVAMQQGLDLVAAYSDHHARYYNYSGAGVVWERPTDMLDVSIDSLLSVGGSVVQVIGPWEAARPPAPPMGYARFNVLTPSGLYFGQGLLEALSKDRLAGAVLAAAFALMQKLIALTKK
jgi:hypothetical protein